MNLSAVPSLQNLTLDQHPLILRSKRIFILDFLFTGENVFGKRNKSILIQKHTPVSGLLSSKENTLKLYISFFEQDPLYIYIYIYR